MTMKRLTLILLLLAGSASAGRYGDTPLGDSSEVTGTMTISTGGTAGAYRLYYFDGNVECAGDGLTISAVSYVYIDGRGDTLWFDADSAGSVQGIYVGGGVSNVIVANLTIMQKPTGGAQEYGCFGGGWVDGVQIAGNTIDRFIMDSCNVHVYGYASQGVAATGSHYENIEFYKGNYTTYGIGYPDRQVANVAAFWLGWNGTEETNGDLFDPDSCNYWVHGVTVDSCSHAAMVVGGVVWVDSNYVLVDAQNTDTTAFNSGSWANAHAIADLYSTRSGSRFRYNTIRSGTNHNGGRGMYFNLTYGYTQVWHNDIRTSEGWNKESTTSRGMRIRYAPESLDVAYNYIEVNAYSVGDTVGYPYRSLGAHGIWFGDAEVATEKSGWGRDCQIHHNTIVTNFLGSGYRYGEIAALMVEIVPDTLYPEKGYGNGHRVYDNVLISNVHPIQFGAASSRGSHAVCSRDSLVYTSPWYSDNYSWRGAIKYGSGTTHPGDSNLLIDYFYDGPDSLFLTRGASGPYGSTEGLRTVQVAVVDSADNPIVGAEVEFKDAYDVVYLDTTDASGIASDTLKMVGQYWDGSSETDSTFNPYILTIRKDGDSLYQSTALSDDSTAVMGSQVWNIVWANLAAGEEAATQHRRKGGKIIGGKIR